MKFSLLIWGLAIVLTTNNGQAQESRVQTALKTNAVVTWVGLDYSRMRLIGNTNSLRVPDLLLQGMPARWNELFLDERIEGVARSLKCRMNIDIQAVTEANRKLSRDQVVFGGDTREAVDESHLKLVDIEHLVKAYDLKSEDGIGLVFIVDRFVCAYIPGKVDKQGTSMPKTVYYGAAYVVFFDIKTREVLSSKREVHSISNGGSFRNFWFGPIKDIDDELGSYRPH